MRRGRRQTSLLQEIVAIPESVPGVGIEAGAPGTIVTAYDGRMLDVGVSREDGVTIGFVDLEVAGTAL